MLGARGTWLLLAALVPLTLLSVLVAVSVGAVGIPLGDVWSVVLAHLGGGSAVDAVQDQIVWDLRAPRALLAVVVGSALAVAGVALQALVRNPLADPYVLGVASGASLGAVAVIVLGSAAVGGLGLSAGAFAGAMTAMALVFLLARGRGAFAPGRLILAGVAIGYLASALTGFLQFLADPRQLQSIVFWLLGSLAGATWSDLRLPALALVIATAWLLLQGRRLNALALGEESAVALGVDVRRVRVELIAVSSLLVATAVAVSGAIGFVGLVVPHVARLLVGPDHRRVLPLAVLLGGAFLAWSDVVARVVAAPSELPLGIFTATVGTPFLLGLMRRGRATAGAV